MSRFPVVYPSSVTDMCRLCCKYATANVTWRRRAEVSARGTDSRTSARQRAIQADDPNSDGAPFLLALLRLAHAEQRVRQFIRAARQSIQEEDREKPEDEADRHEKEGPAEHGEVELPVYLDEVGDEFTG